MKLNKHVVCADGFKMSVQAHYGAYCSPRPGGSPWGGPAAPESFTGPFYEVEVGYPSAREELLMPHCEDPEKPTDTVYGYVPVQVVRDVIAAHGGMVSGELPNMEAP